MSPVLESVVLVGRRLGAEDQRLRDFFTRAAQPYEWLEAGSAPADELLRRHRLDEADLPVVVANGEPVGRATVEGLAEAWRLNPPPSRDAYDLVIVGAGPAGLAAAVYAASDGLSTLVVEADLPGGQASYTALIENFFGFPDGIGGAELARLAGRQAERFGAELVLLRGVTGSSTESGHDGFGLEIAGGHIVRAPVAVACPGMDWRRLDAPGVEELHGRGVLYGAGRSEAAQCSGDDVIVVGAGNSAGQAAVHLANSGARVKLLVRGDALGKSMSAYLVVRIEAHPLIDVRLRTGVVEVTEAEGWISQVVVSGPGGETESLPARMMFLCLGGVPRTGWAEATGVQLDSAGYVLTGADLLLQGARPSRWELPRDPLAVETSVPGLFAAGDVRSGSIKRVGAAVGEGAMAAALVHRRLEELDAAS